MGIVNFAHAQFVMIGVFVAWFGWARLGLDPLLASPLAFALGAGLTALGGSVIQPYITVSPTIGSQFVVLMFTAVVLGGLGNVAGALVGGLAVGVVQSQSALVFPIQLQNLVLFVV